MLHPKLPPILGYRVVDAQGFEWCHVLYEGMAAAIATRCNQDRALNSRGPFTVAEPAPAEAAREACHA